MVCLTKVSTLVVSMAVAVGCHQVWQEQVVNLDLIEADADFERLLGGTDYGSYIAKSAKKGIKGAKVKGKAGKGAKGRKGKAGKGAKGYYGDDSFDDKGSKGGKSGEYDRKNNIFLRSIARTEDRTMSDRAPPSPGRRRSLP